MQPHLLVLVFAAALAHPTAPRTTPEPVLAAMAQADSHEALMGESGKR